MYRNHRYHFDIYNDVDFLKPLTSDPRYGFKHLFCLFFLSKRREVDKKNGDTNMISWIASIWNITGYWIFSTPHLIYLIWNRILIFIISMSNRHLPLCLYSHRQKKLYTSLNRRKIISNKDRIDLKTGNKAEIH